MNYLIQSPNGRVFNVKHNNWLSANSAVNFAIGFNTIDEAIEKAKALKTLNGTLFNVLNIVVLGRQGEFVTERHFAKIDNKHEFVIIY